MLHLANVAPPDSSGLCSCLTTVWAHAALRVHVGGDDADDEADGADGATAEDGVEGDDGDDEADGENGEEAADGADGDGGSDGSLRGHASSRDGGWRAAALPRLTG